MIIDGKYVEVRTSSHSTGVPSKLWKIDYNNGVSNSIIVEAETIDEAKLAGFVESRKNSGFTGSLTNRCVDDIIKSAVCIKDFSEVEPKRS